MGNLHIYTRCKYPIDIKRGVPLQKIERAAQANFFGKWVELMNIYVARVLYHRCRDGHKKRSMCSSCIHIFVIVIYVHYFRLLNKQELIRR